METPLQQPTPNPKKELYILSLDNARLFWILAIAILILVFLFLLGYWLGHDNTAAPNRTGGAMTDPGRDLGTLRDELEKSLPGNDSLSARRRPLLDEPGAETFDSARQKQDAREPRNPDENQTAQPRERLLLPDSPDTRQEVSSARLKSAHEQKEFESLKASKPTTRAAAPTAKPATVSAKTPTPAARPVTKPATTPAVAAAPPLANDRIAGSLSPQTLAPQGNTPQAAGNYAVQVASLSSQTAADELCHKLAARGFQAGLHTALIDGRTWYRVRITGYTSQADARQARDAVNTSGLASGAFVVKQ